MDAVLELLASHRSVRSFVPRDVEPALLSSVYAAALRSPSWNNAQNVTLIEVRDPARKNALAALCGKQDSIRQAPVFTVLVMDFHKTSVAAARHGRQQTAHEDVNGLLIGAVDGGIVLSALMVAARAAGLGVCPIGGIRREPAAVIDLLQLPALTLPLAGLCMGYTDEPAGPAKPRLPLASFCHPERYDASRIAPAVQAIDDATLSYRQAHASNAPSSWSDAVSARYDAMPAYAGVAEVLQTQGFRFGANS